VSCPYPDCSGDIQSRGSFGYCKDCKLPVFCCPVCKNTKTYNRTLARFCVACGCPISLPENKDVEGVPLNQILDFSSHARRINLPESIWIRPLNYKGFLWCLSAAGNLYGLSPHKEKPEYFCSLGEDFGKSPNLVQEWGPFASPIFLALGPKSLKTVSLLNLVTDEFSIELDPGESVLCNMQGGFFGLVGKDESVFFLTRTSEEIRLASLSLKTRKAQKVPLPVTNAQIPVVGPVNAGGHIVLYSRESLFKLNTERSDAWQLTPIPFEVDFQPIVTPAALSHSSLDMPLGIIPPLVSEDYLYIPGTSRAEPAFLTLGLEKAITTFSILKVPPGIYDSGPRQQLVLASRGRVLTYRGLLAETPAADEQILGERCVFHHNSLSVTFARPGRGGRVLRWYSKGKDAQDYPFGDPEDFREALGFFVAGSCIMFVYTNGTNKSVMIVWDLYR